MDYQVSGLDERDFDHLFGKSSEALAEHGVRRFTVDTQPGYPCRVSLQDAEIGETVLLMNYEHLHGPTPYRSSHAIFVREGAHRAMVDVNQVPEMLRVRLLSVRAFDGRGMMVDADVVEGHKLEPMVERMLSTESVSFIHLHNAKQGCFLARVDRS